VCEPEVNEDSDDDANNKRIGYLAVEKFFDKFKKLGRNTENEKHLK